MGNTTILPKEIEGSVTLPKAKKVTFIQLPEDTLDQLKRHASVLEGFLGGVYDVSGAYLASPGTVRDIVQSVQEAARAVSEAFLGPEPTPSTPKLQNGPREPFTPSFTQQEADSVRNLDKCRSRDKGYYCREDD